MRRLALLCASLVACADGPIADSTPAACAENPVRDAGPPRIGNDGSTEHPGGDVADASPPTKDLDGSVSDADAKKPVPIVNPKAFRCRVREVEAAEDFGIWYTGVGGDLPHVTITVHQIDKESSLGQFEGTWNKATDVLTIRASPANAGYEVIGIWNIGLNDEQTVTTNQPGTGNFSVGCWVE